MGKALNSDIFQALFLSSWSSTAGFHIVAVRIDSDKPHNRRVKKRGGKLENTFSGPHF